MASPKFTPIPRSSNVKEVGRCDDGHLYVRFLNGRLYRWDGMAGEHHDAMISAGSGTYLKNLPKGVKVPE